MCEVEQREMVGRLRHKSDTWWPLHQTPVTSHFASVVFPVCCCTNKAMSQEMDESLFPAYLSGRSKDLRSTSMQTEGFEKTAVLQTGVEHKSTSAAAGDTVRGSKLPDSARMEVITQDYPA